MALVLVVDDESSIRVLLRGILARLGHRTIEASDGCEALSLCQQHADALDLLLTDVVMPSMDGLALAEAVSVRFPRLPIIYMSGQCEIEIVQRQMADKGHGFLRKPFQLDVLADTVGKALGGAGRKPGRAAGSDRVRRHTA
jgi:DNA-binding NtrC family response regulator